MSRQIRVPACPLQATAFACLLLVTSFGAQAQGIPSAPKPFVEELRQQERERTLREQQERNVDTRPQEEARTEDQRLPAQEAPCFRIDRLTLTGERSDSFEWVLDAAAGLRGDDSPMGRCIGTQGVNIVLARLQQALIAKGWVTTRVLATPQDLSQGTLMLTIVPGRIAAIRFAGGTDSGYGATTSLRNAIPAQPGDLLNLRDIEQGLENLKRLPTAEADIQIEPSTAPGAKPGESDLVVKYSRKFPLRTTLSLDDSGTKATGQNQTGATVAWDGPLGLDDLAYVSLNHDAFNHKGSGTYGQTLHYSIPYGDWLLGATASRNGYHQTVAGLTQSYIYSGESRNAEVRLSRLLYRDAKRKTTAALRVQRRSSTSDIDDTEIEIQRRVVSSWEASLNHKEYIGEATLEGTLAWRQGFKDFGALAAPEEAFDEGTSRFRLATAEVSANVPFSLGGQKLRYSGLWRAQWNRTNLAPLDRFAIGGRYTVRGFDGESTLLGDRGFLIRNDLGLAIGQTGAELYVGMGYGQVGGRSTQQLIGTHLAGAVLGVRGEVKAAGTQLTYDVFVGTPISKPEGFRTGKVTAGFNLNFSF
ncbi:ShlB/FhaC/HecB family hemolysin secretion/activation protein [Variovorax robiniae]|uniref:ShlB/FhaC/HecB family hemolysin secretion/activation protein n=1 Tax=Variovorax robiniae TaxID=1836199 RepID=A0ABU8XAC8_9BURK